MNRVYYLSRRKTYLYQKTLFEIGQRSECIYVVLMGTIEIVLTDGTTNQIVMDLLGKGSIIGVNFSLTN